jgi:hypothetical protein
VGIALYLGGGEAIAIRQAKSAGPHDPYRPGLHHLCFRVPLREQVDEPAAALRAIGVEATAPALYPEVRS